MPFFIVTAIITSILQGACYSGIRIFNNLPQSIRDLLTDVINFKQALRKFLLLGSFYSLMNTRMEHEGWSRFL
jgi:hypothetical protein